VCCSDKKNRVAQTLPKDLFDTLNCHVGYNRQNTTLAAMLVSLHEPVNAGLNK
jgi:hypothetical protein